MPHSTESTVARIFTRIAFAALAFLAPSLFLGQAGAAEACPCFTAEDTAACDTAPGGLGPTFTVLGEYAGDDKRIVAICGDLRAEYPLYSFRPSGGGCANFTSDVGYKDTSVGQASSCVSLLGDEWMRRNNR